MAASPSPVASCLRSSVARLSRPRHISLAAFQPPSVAPIAPQLRPGVSEVVQVASAHGSKQAYARWPLHTPVLHAHPLHHTHDPPPLNKVFSLAGIRAHAPPNLPTEFPGHGGGQPAQPEIVPRAPPIPMPNVPPLTPPEVPPPSPPPEAVPIPPPGAPTPTPPPNLPPFPPPEVPFPPPPHSVPEVPEIPNPPERTPEIPEVPTPPDVLPDIPIPEIPETPHVPDLPELPRSPEVPPGSPGGGGGILWAGGVAGT